MEPTSKPYAALAVLVPLAAIVFGLIRGWSWFTILFSEILLICCFPLLCAMLCMWLHGNGYRYLNIGIDWGPMGDTERREVASRWGLWLSVGTVVLMLGLALTIPNIVLGLALIAVSVVIMFLPFVGGARKRSPIPAWSRNKRIAVVSAFTLLAIVPFVFVMDGGAGSMSSSVDVSLGDEELTVKAPFFDHSFSYEDVDDCRYFADFPKGKRIMGYHDTNVSSGRYNNSLFGDYELAAYSKVKPCIAISVGGEMYAFNQGSDDLTWALYQSLRERVGI